MPENAEYMRSRALLCRQFADEMRCRKTATGLRRMAADYDVRAKLLVEDAPAL
jgi:hypothetical protein